ncbi:unannotated protein [freshwater metagenome]|uniref:Unannotated protein n=1 Tax=freshwater metagenome TaxID=449393 RepID=A0A6J7I8W4_9ZZZZ
MKRTPWPISRHKWGCSVRGADVGSRTHRSRIAVTANVAALRASAANGEDAAMSTPPSAGPAMVMTVAIAVCCPTASASRARGTSEGSKPKPAASKNTIAAALTNAATNTWAVVRVAVQYASGIDAVAAHAASAVTTIVGRRRQRSATAPANSPNSRYGADSTAVRSAVAAALPVVR